MKLSKGNTQCVTPASFDMLPEKKGDFSITTYGVEFDLARLQTVIMGYSRKYPHTPYRRH